MSATIITLEDLRLFKIELLRDLQEIFSKVPANHSQKKYLKSREVRQILGISPGTLQNLRINGTLSFTRIGSIIFYDHDCINRLLDDNKIVK